MKNEKVTKFQLIGLAVRTSNADQQAATDIPALWNKFMSQNMAAQIPNKVSDELYCVYTDYETDHTGPYTTILGCKVAQLDQIPEGMVGKTMPGGSFAVHTAKGDLTQTAVYDAWLEIWKVDLNRNYTADYEVYGEKAKNPKDGEVEIYVGVL